MDKRFFWKWDNHRTVRAATGSSERREVSWRGFAVITAMAGLFVLAVPPIGHAGVGGDVDCVCGGTFSVGDRVRAIVNEASNNSEITLGLGGTVRGGAFGNPPFLVEWDTLTNGHDGNGACACPGGCAAADPRGWYVECSDVALIAPCGAAPIAPGSCLAAPKAKFQIKDSTTAGKDKLSWQWGGVAFDQSVVGTPPTPTTYLLCVYDTTAMVPSLKASIDLGSSVEFWKSTDPKGLSYKNKAGISEGVTKAQLKTGDATKAKVKVAAKGLNLALPAPAGATFFNQGPEVVVQLVNSEGTCWTSTFASGDTKTNDASGFKAQVK